MTDKTKQRIQELVPEVMGQCSSCGKINPQVVDQCDYKELPHTNVKRKDITLAVVLRAIEKKVQGMKVSEAIMRDGNPAHPLHWRDEKWLDTVWKWNLTKDNYDDQSEETKAFIGKLLGV